MISLKTTALFALLLGVLHTSSAQESTPWRVVTLEAGREIRSADISYDGTRALLVTSDSMARSWETASGEEPAFRLLEVQSARYSPVAHIAAVRYTNHAATGFRNDSLAELQLTGNDPEVRCMAFSRNGLMVATGASNGRIRIHHMDKGRELMTLQNPGAVGVESIEFSGIGTWMLICGSDGSVRVWDTSYRDSPRGVTGRANSPSAVSIASSGDVFAVGVGSEVKIWRVDGSLARTYSNGPDSITSLSFAYRGDRLAVGSAGGRTSIWQLWDDTPRHTLESPDGSGGAVRFSGDGRRLVTWGSGRSAHVWNTTTGALEYSVSGHGEQLHSAAIDFSGLHLLTAGADNTAKVWYLHR